MPVQRRPEGSYQVTVSIGGRKVRRSSRDWTYKDAKSVEAELLQHRKRVAAGLKPERSLEEGLAEWLEKHAPKLRSARQSRNHARMLFPHIRGKKLSEAPAVWAEIKQKLAKQAPATINHKGRILRQICNLAFTEWQWIDAPIGSRIKLLPETPREQYLTPEQVDALALSAGKDAGDMIRLAAFTGIRRGHLLRLTASDFRGGFLTLDRTGKTRKPQQVPVHPEIAGIVERLPLPISDWQLSQAWTAARKACGLSHARWHDLRHTCASWLVQNGVPLKTVQEILGHSTIAQTQKYAHFAPHHLMDAILKIPGTKRTQPESRETT